jgi:LPS-assembly protein
MRYRLATLAVALAAAAPAGAQGPAAPAAGSEPSPTTVDAQKIEGISDLEVTARGAAEIRRGEIGIFGEYLRYNREFGRLDGEGGVRMQSGVDRFFGPTLQYDTLEDSGIFDQPGFLLQRERPARGGAERLEFRGKNQYRLTNASFTTCQPGQDDWFLQASQLDLDYDQMEGNAKWPRLRFFDYTLFTFPFGSFPLENRRKSGLLMPYYSQTSTRGLEFGIPYYWNIAPERDATFTPVYMARRGFQLKNHLRYLERPYAGELKFEYLPSDPIFGRARSGTSWQHTHTLGPGTTAQVDYNKVSDDRYFVDLASQVKQVSVGNLPQDAFVTRGGALPGAGSYSTQARVQRFQTLQDPLAPIVPPYHRMPQLNASAIYNDVAGRFDTALPGEYVRFVHPTLVEGARASMMPTLALPRIAPGWFVTPKAGLRYATYNLDRADAGEPTTPSTAVPWISLDSGLVFERAARLFGQAATQTLEPRLFYLLAPYHNQDHIPVFDTSLADFNYAQLFSENRFVGGDRFGDANQLTLALTSRFLFGDGQEGLRMTIGQRYYFRDERVALNSTAVLRQSNESDILASVGGRFSQRWIYDATTQYNPTDHRLERYGISMRYSPELAKVLNASYRYQRDILRQIDLSTQWPVFAGWYAVGRYNYSFLDKRLLEGLAGAEYNAGCWVFRAVVQKIQASSQVASTALIFQLEFTGVGQIGTAEAVQLLRRDVPGYSVINRGDPALMAPSARPRLPFEQVF